MKAAAFAYFFAMAVAMAGGGHAGKLINLDDSAYDYVIHWQDLRPATRGTLGPKEEVGFRDGRGILQLLGANDNIYVKASETIYIRNGVMNKDPGLVKE